MRLKPEAKKEITQRIRASAAKAMRLSGADKVNLDEVMAGAGLTRGAFYAHYNSKAALLADVVAHEHPLLAMLRRRPGPDGAALKAQMDQIFRDYLEPAHHAEIYAGCTLASLTPDAARASDDVRAGFGAGFELILTEMAREQAHAPGDYAALLALAAGAVNMAMALPEGRQRDGLLRSSQGEALRMLAELG